VNSELDATPKKLLMDETATISISYNGNIQGEGAADKARTKHAEMKRRIEAIALESGITEITITNENVSISGNRDSYGEEMLFAFMVNGSISYEVKPVALADLFFKKLVDAKIPASLNVTRNRKDPYEGGC
jgi:hypothetical protein